MWKLRRAPNVRHLSLSKFDLHIFCNSGFNVVKFHQNSKQKLAWQLTLNSWKLKKLHTWLKTNGEYGFRPIGRRKNNIHSFRFQLEISDLSGYKKTIGLPNKRFHRSIHNWNRRKFKMPDNLPGINSRRRRINLFFHLDRPNWTVSPDHMNYELWPQFWG